MEYDLKELIEVYKEKIKSDLYRIEDLGKKFLKKFLKHKRRN